MLISSGNNDRLVVQEVIKEIASHVSLSSKATSGGGASGNGKSFKVVILNEVDKLSRQAQAGFALKVFDIEKLDTFI